MTASLESDVKQVLGSEKGPFHRVVGLPVIFGSPGDFLLGGSFFDESMKMWFRMGGSNNSYAKPFFERLHTKSHRVVSERWLLVRACRGALIFLPPAFFLGVLEEVTQDASVENAFGRGGCGVEDAVGPHLAIQRVHAGVGQLGVRVVDVAQGESGAVDLGLEDATPLCAKSQILQPGTYGI